MSLTVKNNPGLLISTFTNPKVENDLLVLHNNVKQLDESYSLQSMMEKENSLVTYQKNDVLANINLERLLFELNLCSDLYNVVYNACFGIKGLSANVVELRLNFCSALRESVGAATTFKATTSGVLTELSTAYGFLCENESEVALDILSEVSKSASGLKEESARIKGLFEKVLEDSEKASKSIVQKNEDLYEEFDYLKKKRDELAASYTAYNSMQQSFKEQSENLQEEISETKADLKEQEERAYNLALTSAIMCGISGIANGVGQALAKPGVNINNTPQPTDKTSTQNTGAPNTTGNAGSDNSASGTTRDEKAEKGYTEANEKLQSLNEKKEDLDKRIGDIDKAIADKKYGGKTEAEIIEEQKKLKEELKGVSVEIPKVSKSMEAYKAALEGLGYAFDKVSGALQKMSEKADAKSDNLRTELKDLRKQKHDFDVLYAENLAKAKESAVRLSQSISGEKDLAVVIDSLILAIAALHNIIAFLEMITVFWAKIESSCNALKSNNDTIVKMASKIKNVSLFKGAMFTFSYYRSFAFWVALNLIFSDYLAAVEKAHENLTDTFKENADSRESARSKAKELAEGISRKLGIELVKTGETVKMLEKELENEQIVA